MSRTGTLQLHAKRESSFGYASPVSLDRVLKGAGIDQPRHPISSPSRPGHSCSVPRSMDLTGAGTGSADSVSVAFMIVGEVQFAGIPSHPMPSR